SLGAKDVLIAPELGKLTSSDFERTRELIAAGERGSEPLAARLAALALPEAAYAQWRAARPQPGKPEARVAFIRFEGTELTNPQRFAAQLESRPGQPFDSAKAERDARRLAASGDYLRADYLLVSSAEGDGLVFDLEDKPWGPHYFRIGLDLATDFRGGSGFNVKISHNRHWLDANGSEWRNQVQIGEVPRWYTEIYHPLNWTLGLSNDWFLSAYAEALRRDITRYDNDSGAVVSLYNRKSGTLGIDLGQPWAELGELRMGLTLRLERTTPEVVTTALSSGDGPSTVRETGLRVAAVVDQLDFANFPTRGYRFDAEAVGGRRSRSESNAREDFTRLEGEGTLVRSWGQHTLNLYARVQRTPQDSLSALGRYTLGGFHQLSGYRSGQLDGNSVVFTRLTWYRRSLTAPVFTRGFFVGATLEAGNAWARWSEVRARELRSGMSAFLGADTGLGPVYFGLTYAPRGSAGLYLFVGRP
ncbi:BamA/TamA family outer membrane protein, partial [Piscinibacter sp.]|uniref:BamA/TamA family outer membrane protein n=1 Tax=Piscinibacter sp. TaxID=1903157 RepID=UPI0035AF6210